MQAMFIAKMHCLSTYYIAMCSPVVLLCMDFPDQIFASTHLLQICKCIGWHKNASLNFWN